MGGQMGTIFRYTGFRFFAYSGDHNYPVSYAEGEMVFEVKETEITLIRVHNYEEK